MTQTLQGSPLAWPKTLRAGAVRWSRRSRRYDATVHFYRDLVRLPVLAEFTDSFGEDGTVFGLPDSSVHLEILREPDGDPAAIGQDELVVYLDGPEAVDAATAGLRAAGRRPDCEGHPYWEANGAMTYRDPDGRALVFAPWVFGRVPDPVDRPDDADSHSADRILIEWYDGDRRALRPLFEEAEDSPTQLDSYLGSGRVLTGRLGGEIVGHLQLTDTSRDGVVELKNMAVAPERRGMGIGRSLVGHAVAIARTEGYSHMVVATAAADIDNLRFYQHRGFRFDAVERDAFGELSGYGDDIMIDGIPLQDRVWFTLAL